MGIKDDREISLSCTFCGPGTWATWDVVTDDGVFFVCDKHHVEMSQATIIRLERLIGQNEWTKITQVEERFHEDEYLNNLKDFDEINEDE
ncbi:MAG: hypothetical protein ACOYZ6_07315 [Chloroflexota bacterium]